MNNRIILAVLAGLLCTLAACAAPVPQAAPEQTVPATTETQAAPASTQTGATDTSDADGSFPVTIEHKYGRTEILERPERIVTVGLTDHDALLALGIVPVGTTEWFGGYPGAVWPWAQDELEALGGAVPELVGDGSTINFEKIAALQPDLILALYGGLTPEEYDLLTQIAPTVAQPAEYVDYGIPWQELTRTVGRIVGKAEQADALVADVEERLAQVRAEHPEFMGASAVVATPYEGIWVYGRQDPRGRFLTSLGFELPAGLDEITGQEFGGNLSLERVDLLDVDVIIWLDAEDADMGAAGDDLLLAGPVALDLGRRAFDPQQLGRIAEGDAVVEIDLQGLLRLLQADLGRPMRRLELRHRGSNSLPRFGVSAPDADPARRHPGSAPHRPA